MENEIGQQGKEKMKKRIRQRKKGGGRKGYKKIVTQKKGKK